ncbi:class I SAM-dependent methyltransferase [Achromobacter sp. NPDC058515]|uniref:class I SAM-dependent methyltransferase n=1 Tax=Achromobacter sp. NPDC058515 TaxID=3346533 RepID=UPI0036533ADB
MVRQLAKKILLSFPAIRRVIHERDCAREANAQLQTQLQAATAVADQLELQLRSSQQTATDLESKYTILSAGTLLANDASFQPHWDTLFIPESFQAEFREVMLQTFYRDNPLIDISNTEVFERDLSAHTEHRYRVFERWIATWLETVAPDMSTLTALEVGSGTGSSTLAFARKVSRLISFEIDTKATDAARSRLRSFGFSNVEFHDGQFNASSEFYKTGENVDLVVLCAVLEHMTEDERRDTLQAAWSTLKSGGLLVVADTPNRFAVYDDHTSLLPYYSALPPWIQRDYSPCSPRADFRNSIQQTASEMMTETLARWGAGISYHDFELAIGQSIHDNIVLDGYEPSLLAMYPDKIDDGLMRIAFDHYKIPAHRAFTRSLLHFVIRKP